MRKFLRTEISPPPLKRQRRHDCERQLLPGTAPTLSTRPVTALEGGQLRIFTWNVNGVQPFLQPPIDSYFAPSSPESDASPEHSAPVSDLRSCLRRWKWPQVVCLQEVKIAAGDAKTQHALRKAVMAPAGSGLPSYDIVYSLPRDRFNARGLGGTGRVHGVATLVRRDVFEQYKTENEVPRTGTVEWDLEGRITTLSLPRPRLVVINIYAVNANDRPYRDPKLGSVVGTRHDFKRTVHARLRDMIAGYEARGWSAVVAGDLNIARGSLDGFPGIRLAPVHVDHRRDFAEKFMAPRGEGGLAMCDSFRHLHGAERKYTFRKRHKKLTSLWRLRKPFFLFESQSRTRLGLNRRPPEGFTIVPA
ncbi:hypothetical protein P8C59_006150 [Phyllachora maydis]|uniref:Endonuclease/exonuclease/phosphatase domain-containing protein n=1 Tax=Phyllachora maydis TaxID=1825666 RepID=A0AAD9MF81_9PEZI|nr:hypothetical protein P8C59_006150 [Phyllachora maydis]